MKKTVFYCALFAVFAAGAVENIAAPGKDVSPIQLREWRMTTKNLNAEMLPEYSGRKFVVKIDYPMIPGGKTLSQTMQRSAEETFPPLAGEKIEEGELNFATRPLHSPFDNWIPPYIGISAKEIRFFFLPEKVTGNITASMKFYFLEFIPGKSKIAIETKNISMGENRRWSEIVIPVTTSRNRRLSNVVLSLQRSDSKSSCELFMISPVIVTRYGEKYEILNTEMPRLLRNAPSAPKNTAKQLPKRNTLSVGFGGPWWAMTNLPSLPKLSQFMKDNLPDLDIVLSPSRSPEPATGDIIKELPDNIYYQFQRAQHGIKYPALFGALPISEHGKMQNFRFNSLWAIHPLILDGLKEQFDYAASHGINSFKVYDYVWPYLGGRWGYDDASIAAFRRDLEEKDEGLRILESKDKVKTIHFPDYFRSIHGMMPSPQDLGLKGWNEYVPVKTKDLKTGTSAIRLNYSILLALCSYEWLLQAQRWNTWAKAHGGTHEYLLNLEAWQNAGDYINLIRLADSGIVSKEFFVATPNPVGLGSIYSGSGLYLRTAKRIGHEMGYCCEVSSGGGSSQPYWDAKVAYSLSYMLAALGYRHLHHDHHNAKFEKWLDPKSGNAFAGVSLMMSQGRALQQALREKVRKPDSSSILNVRCRSVGITVPNMMGRDFLAGEWRPALMDSSIDFEDTDPEELPLMLPKAEVVFYAPHATRKDSAEQLTAWLKQGKNRTLVLHSVVPFRQEKGYAVAERIVKEEIPADAPSLFPGFAKGTIQNGTVLLKKADGSPLLSEYKVSEGGRIWYLHPAPEKCGKADLNKVMSYLTEKLALPQRQIAGGDVLVLPFEEEGNSVYVLWNAPLARKAYSKEREWHRKCWSPTHHQSKFKHGDLLYYWYQPGFECSAKVRVKKPGTYRLYSFLADRENVVDVGSDHLLPLTLSEALTEIVYAAPDTPEFRKKIAELRRERVKTGSFFRIAEDK